MIFQFLENVASRNSVSMQSHYMIKHSRQGSAGLKRTIKGLPLEAMKQSKDVELMAGNQYQPLLEEVSSARILELLSEPSFSLRILCLLPECEGDKQNMISPLITP